MAKKKKSYTSYRVVESGATTKKPVPPPKKESNQNKGDTDKKDAEVK